MDLTRIAPVPGQRALVIANAPLPRRTLLEPLVHACRPIVAADGGANRALEAGIKLQAVLGDLDSIEEGTRAEYGEEILHLLPDPEATDLEKTVSLLYDLHHREITIVGVAGGRLDHTLGNLSVLRRFAPFADILAIDDEFEIRYVVGTWVFDAPVGTMVSLVAPGPAEGITTEGLRFALAGSEMDFTSRGIHNEVVSNPVRRSVASGGIFLFRAHAEETIPG
jgi:thiamine pyrophosphokinase